MVYVQNSLRFLELMGYVLHLLSATSGLKIDQRGRHFVLAFPDSGTVDNTNLLMVTSQYDVIVYVIVPEHSLLKYTIPPHGSENIFLPHKTTVTSNMLIEKKGIRIMATQDVSVYGYVFQYDSVGGFLALPVEGLSTEYIVVTYLPHDGSGGHLVVVAVEDDTDVEIVMKLPDAATCNRMHVPQGHKFNMRLQSLDVVRIHCDQDITGTFVRANKPVGVMAGNPLTQVPPSVQFPDNLVEMMVPTYAFGHEFLLAPDNGRKCGTIYRILAKEKNTQVIGSNGTVHLLQAREYVDVEYEQDERGYIQSSKPILVMQFGKGKSADSSTNNGDPYMVTIPPVDRYSSTYDLDMHSAMASPGNDVTSYVTVYANSSITDGFDFSASFEEVPGCNLSMATRAGDKGLLKLTHRLGLDFGVTVHGYTSWKAYGYMGGLALDDYSGHLECSVGPCEDHELCYEVGHTFGCYCPRTSPECQLPMEETTITTDIIVPVTTEIPTLPEVSTSPTETTSDPETSEPTPTVKVTTDPEVVDQSQTTINIMASLANPCNCTCKNMTYEEVEKKAEVMKKELTVNPTVLSRSKRKYVSMQDSRMSASSLGYLGGVFLALAFGSIFLVDLSTVISRWLGSMRNNARTTHRRAQRNSSIHRSLCGQVSHEDIMLHMNPDVVRAGRY